MDAQQDSAIMNGDDDFEVTMRGYNRRQVDDFVARTRSELGDLEQRLAVARRETERVRKELATVKSEMEVQQEGSRPAHAAISERLSQILRLAAEEADQERAAAEAAIAEMRAKANSDVEDLRRRTDSDCEEMRRTAKDESEQERTRARDEAARLLSSSQDESERTIAAAKDHANRLVAAAERRAQAVTEVANRRLATLVERHTETVERLSEMRETLIGLLSAEADAGSLEGEVERLTGPSTVLDSAWDAETAAAAEPSLLNPSGSGAGTTTGATGPVGVAPAPVTGSTEPSEPAQRDEVTSR